MSRIIVPSQDAYYQIWIENFAAVALANAADLGLTTGQTTALTALATAFSTKFAASEASKTTTKSKVADKDNARTVSEQLFRSTAKLINSNVNISNALKADLGISVTPTTPGPVTIPSDLKIESNSSGVNKLTWKANGNSQGTAYLIESLPPGASLWSILAVSTARKFEHMGQVPGVQTSYRVTAQRAGIKGAPTVAVTAYDDDTVDGVTLKVA